VKKTQNIHTYLHARSCDALPELFFLSSWLIAWSKKKKKKKKKYYSGRRRPTTPHLLASLLQRISFPLAQNQNQTKTKQSVTPLTSANPNRTLSMDGVGHMAPMVEI
jgi:hypothetical protein